MWPYYVWAERGRITILSRQVKLFGLVRGDPNWRFEERKPRETLCTTASTHPLSPLSHTTRLTSNRLNVPKSVKKNYWRLQQQGWMGQGKLRMTTSQIQACRAKWWARLRIQEFFTLISLLQKESKHLSITWRVLRGSMFWRLGGTWILWVQEWHCCCKSVGSFNNCSKFNSFWP